MELSRAASGSINLRAKLQSQLRDFRKNRTFIVPTSFGILFGGVCFILLFLALGYQNNVIYVFTFYAISVGFTSMLFTNRNVERLNFDKILRSDYYANENNKLQFLLDNNSAEICKKIETSILTKNRWSEINQLKSQQKNDISPNSSTLLNVDWRPASRGKVEYPRLSIFSTYPFGLLKAWKVLRTNEHAIVFPERKGNKLLPDRMQNLISSKENNLYKQHREFQSGDSVRRIDWKASIKRDDLLVRTYESESDNKYCDFKWSDTRFLNDVEARVSQLCLWITVAEDLGLDYSLELTSLEIQISKGKDHYKDCLSALALFKPETN